MWGVQCFTEFFLLLLLTFSNSFLCLYSLSGQPYKFSSTSSFFYCSLSRCPGFFLFRFTPLFCYFLATRQPKFHGVSKLLNNFQKRHFSPFDPFPKDKIFVYKAMSTGSKSAKTQRGKRAKSLSPIGKYSTSTKIKRYTHILTHAQQRVN